MKKNVLLFSLLLLSLTSFSQTKIGTIDADYIIAQMPEMSEVTTGLEVYNTELKTDFETSIAEYETLVESYQENIETFTEEERQTQEGEIISLENDIQGFQQKAGVMMQMKRNELTEPLYNIINEAMLEVIEEEGFTQILHAGATGLAYSAEGYDITLKVLEKLGIEIEEEE